MTIDPSTLTGVYVYDDNDGTNVLKGTVTDNHDGTLTVGP